MKLAVSDEQEAEIQEIKLEDAMKLEKLGALEDFDEEFDRMFLKGELPGDDSEQKQKEKTNPNRRTFVVSATLGKAFFSSRMMTKKVKSDLKKILKENPETVPNMKLKEIMKYIVFKHKTKVIDITQEVFLPETLEILKVDCITEDKLLYLYYFVNIYKDKRIIIFTNSITSSNRIKSLLALSSK